MSLSPHPPEMIDIIIDDNIERIESDLKARGMTYDRLIDDLLDHVCCLIEEGMETGKDFETSYSQVLDSVGEYRLKEIEHHTLLLLDKKFQKMKKTTYVIGLVAAFIMLFGTLAKKMHWPGAGMALTLGLLAIVFVFLPLYFIVTRREQVEKKNIIYPLVGYLTISILLVGAVFKVQHWAGTGIILTIGMAVLLIGFVPLYTVNAFQKAKGEKVGLPYIVMVLVGLALILLINNAKLTKNQLEAYRTEAILNEERVNEIEAKTSMILASPENSASEDIMQVHKMADELQTMIDDMLEEMLQAIKEPGINLETMEKIDMSGVGRKVILESGWARKFMKLSGEYQQYLMGLIADPVTKNQIEDHLEYNGDVWYYEWGPDEVINDPVIKIFYKHSDVSKGIALSEYVAISYLAAKYPDAE